MKNKSFVFTVLIASLITAFVPYLSFLAEEYFTHTGLFVIILSWFAIFPLFFLFLGYQIQKYHQQDKIILILPLISALIIYFLSAIITSFVIIIYFISYLVLCYLIIMMSSILKNQEKRKKR